MKVRVSYNLEIANPEFLESILQRIGEKIENGTPIAYFLNEKNCIEKIIAIAPNHEEMSASLIWKVNIDCDCIACKEARNVAEQICTRSHDD